MHDIIANAGVTLLLIAGTSLWLYAKWQESPSR